MKRILLILTMGFLLGACGAEKGIEIHQAWVRPAARGENAAVYFVIHNHSSAADELMGVSTDVAEAAEMHESTMNGDVMQMRPVQSVPLQAFDDVSFAPGKLHVMLVHLKQELKTGDEIEIILHFKNAGDRKIKVIVRDTPAPEEDHSSTDHG